MKREFAVLGLGRFGSSVARTLFHLGHEVLGVDIDEARVQAMVDHTTQVLQADLTDEATLRSLGLRNFEVVVVAMSDMEASILVTLMCKEIGCKTVVAKAASEQHGKVLARIGADRVIFPERDSGARLAHSLTTANLLDVIELTPDVSVAELTAGEWLGGKTLRELDLARRFGVTVVAVRRKAEIRLPVPADERIREGDVLVVIAKNEDLARLEEARGTREGEG
ncbi:MAG: TrkA family potassium uptake protein [Clostridia bacterium]|nr:TrkA family potassium uptake protein [Clostridia bacterium]